MKTVDTSFSVIVAIMKRVNISFSVIVTSHAESEHFF